MISLEYFDEIEKTMIENRKRFEEVVRRILEDGFAEPTDSEQDD